MMRLRKIIVAPIIALAGTAALAGENGLQELDREQLERQAVSDSLAPMAVRQTRQMQTLEAVEEQQRLLPETDYVARPQTPVLPRDTGATAAQQQFLQSLINAFGSAAESAR